MSIKVQGKHSLKAGQIKVLNVQPTYGLVSVDIHGHVNRDTNGKLISKYLKNGWNWNLFGPIAVAMFPIDSGIEPKLLDGDHRRHMFILTFPDAEEIPAMIYQVKDMEEYHELFTDINLYHRKNASPEEVYVHDVKSFRKDALAISQELIRCGLCVHGSSDTGGIVGLVPGKKTHSPRVKIGGFRRALKQGSQSTKLAASLVKATWPKAEEVKVELLEGLAVLFKLYPALSSSRSKINSDFEQWFTTRQALYEQRVVATDYKAAGGSVVNKAAACVARGIINDFRKVNSPNASRASKNKSLPLARINDIIEG
tara:strand:+ start:1481 stop:2416 length:936 start_codon:yes stop_codon:yes gene_type:complete